MSPRIIKLTGQLRPRRHGCTIMLSASAPTDLLLYRPKQPDDRLQRAWILLSSFEGILHFNRHSRRRGHRWWSLQWSDTRVRKCCNIFIQQSAQ